MQGNLSCKRQLIFLFFLISPLAFSFLYAAHPEEKVPGGYWFAPFIQNVPADTTVACLNDVPEAPVLFALDGTDTIPGVLATDFPEAASLDICSGGVILRVWTAMGSDGSVARDTQVITVLPDNTAPLMGIPDAEETIACDALNYTDWLNIQRARALGLSEDCSALTITDDAPAVFSGACETLVVTFTLTDQCGQSNTWHSTLHTLDTVPPTLSFVPADTVLSCLETIPPPAAIVATDNCSAAVTQSFQEISNQQTNGSCAAYEYEIERLWTFADGCGNTRVVRQKITIVDNSAPLFSAPPNTTVSCASDWQNPATTGRPVNIIDCDPDVNVTFTDIVEPGSCPGNFRVRRIWTLSDTCGNLSSANQIITVVDNEKPVFVAPPDVTLSCGEDDTPDNTGRPQQLTDNCTPSEDMDAVVASEVVIAGSCPNNYTIQRTWQVVDQCGNTNSHVQLITVVDESSPLITLEASDLVLDCLEGTSASDVFQTWINNRGGAVATDNCSQNLNWTAINIPGGGPAGLPAINCPANGDTLLFRRVAFIVTDECNNADTTLASFVLLDREAPVIDFCPSDEVIPADPGTCTGTFTIVPPLIRDACISGVNVHSFALEQAITGSATPGNEGETVVDSLDFSFALNLPLPVNVSKDVSLDIRLRSADAESAGEFFWVYGENHTLIGKSALSSLECGDSDTTLIVPAALINEWALDNRIDIYLAPNIPEGAAGNASINPVCPGGYVRAVLDMEVREMQGIAFAYRIDDAAPVFIDPIATTVINLDGGIHTLTYLAYDCAGNGSDCSFTVTVKDSQAPVLSCPADEVLSLPFDSCIYHYELPFPEGTNDNCSDLSSGADIGFFTRGASNFSLQHFSDYGFQPKIDLEVGETEIFYVLEDLSGNADTCSFMVEIQDNQRPRARCKATTVFVSPSGLDLKTINASLLDNGSFDNCGIDTMFASPGNINCYQIGGLIFASLFVQDIHGNINSCASPIRVEAEQPRPVASTGICGGDTLYLFANPPLDGADGIFTYEWYNPSDQLISTDKNPVIPNASASQSGPYRVEIEGLTGCRSSGVVQVTIEAIPAAPEVVTTPFICISEDIFLDASMVPPGSNVKYHWYTGPSADKTLIGTTTDPRLVIPGPHVLGKQLFYLQIEANGCISPISRVSEVVTSEPVASVVANPEIDLCSGESIILGTNISGQGITYQWTGPNGFSSTQQFPAGIEATLGTAGAYALVVLNNGCASQPDFTTVTVGPTPAKPLISNSGPVCAGSPLVLNTNITDASVYTWIAPNLQEYATDENNLLVDEVTPGLAGEWRVIASKSGCDSETSAPTTVVVNSVPTAVAAARETRICEGGSLELEGAPLLDGAVYHWEGPDGFVSNSRNAVLSNIALKNSGDYTLTLTSQAGCVDEASVSIDVLQGVKITAISNDGPPCLEGPTDIRMVATTFPANDGSFSYAWTGPNGFSAYDSIAVIPNAGSSSNGNYQLLVTNGNGCTSPPANTLVNVSDPLATPAAPRLNTATVPPFCFGEDLLLETTAYEGLDVFYNWLTPTGLIVTERPELDLRYLTTDDSGNYSVYVSVDGCISRSSATTNIRVGEIPVVEVSAPGNICSGSQIRLDANFINGATYSWTGPNAFNSTRYNPVINQADTTMSGDYIVTATLNGCVSQPVIARIAVAPAPRIPEIFTDPEICLDKPGSMLNFTIDATTATAGAWYSWYGPEGQIGTESSSRDFALANLEFFSEGTYTFRAQARLGSCYSDFSEPVQVTMNEFPDYRAFAGDDSQACANLDFSLKADAPLTGTGLWTLVSANASGVRIENPALANSSVSGLQGGNTYTFKWTLSNGACGNYDSDEVMVEVISPELPNAGEDQIACIADEIRLDANELSLSLGNWIQSEAQRALGIHITDPLDAKSVVTGMEPGNLYEFTWRVEGGCGTFDDEVFILISDPNPYAGPDQVACNDDQVATLLAREPSSGSKGAWSAINPEVLILDPNKRESMVMGLEPGENLFVWTIDGGICGDLSRDTVAVDFYYLPKAVEDELDIPFGSVTELRVLQNDFIPKAITLSLVGLPSNGTAELVNDSTLSYTPDINFIGSDKLVYEICSDACECSQATVLLNIGVDAPCTPPSIITPNNDQVNDYFVVPCLLDGNNYPGNSLIIINRWGDEVFRSGGSYQNNWNGQYNGEDLPDGTYFYILDFGNNTAPLTGFVEIRR